MKYYEIKHIVGFEDTNLVGNVYYANYMRWQGRCREMFLRDFAPDVIDELRNNLKLFTIRCECEFFSELSIFDEVSIQMSLADITQTQIEFGFEYFINNDLPAQLVAKGSQRVACMQGDNKKTYPVRVPESLVKALSAYM